MNRINITLILLVFLSLPVYAKDPCANSEYWGAQRDCIQVEYKKIDKELNRQYKILKKKIHSTYVNSGELNSVNPISIERKLVKAQRAWVKFRDTECEFVFDRSAGGTGTLAGYMHFLCLWNLTENRTKDFKRYMKEMDDYKKKY